MLQSDIREMWTYIIVHPESLSLAEPTQRRELIRWHKRPLTLRRRALKAFSNS